MAVEKNDKAVSQSMTTTKPKAKPLKMLIPIVILLLILIPAAAAAYFYNQVLQLQKNPQAVAQAENATLLTKVGALIVLPEGETPTIATVNDPAKLKDQPFFAKAKQGDKVLIYTNAKKAILYSPTENKIVEVAPLNIGPSQATAPKTDTNSDGTPSTDTSSDTGTKTNQ